MVLSLLAIAQVLKKKRKKFPSSSYFWLVESIDLARGVLVRQRRRRRKTVNRIRWAILSSAGRRRTVANSVADYPEKEGKETGRGRSRWEDRIAKLGCCWSSFTIFRRRQKQFRVALLVYTHKSVCHRGGGRNLANRMMAYKSEQRDGARRRKNLESHMERRKAGKDRPF